MSLIPGHNRPTAEKIVLTASGVLALALGLGVGSSEADAMLLIQSFSPSDTATLQSGSSVTFGPDGGFVAQWASGGPFTLTGNGFNTVAVTSPTCTSCKLQEFNPGDVIDGSLNFATSGTFKTTIIDVGNVADGNYYFGLDAVAETDPFGWVEITTTDGVPTLDQFAFEDQEDVGAPIPAVPEPGTLAIFAVGAAAVLARRRQRQGAL